MTKPPLAWAVTGLTLARLARRFASPSLPDPGPLPASIPIPDANPPEGMELIAVPTAAMTSTATGQSSASPHPATRQAASSSSSPSRGTSGTRSSVIWSGSAKD